MATRKTTSRARTGRAAKIESLTPAELAELLKRPPSLKRWAEIARQLDVPLWVLLVEGLHEHEELLTADGLKNLAKHVSDYVAADGITERLHFTLDDPAVPIAGTPAARACPFCGYDDCVRVVLESIPPEGSTNGYVRAHVECTACGAEAPVASTNDEGIDDTYAAILESARLWNARGKAEFAKVVDAALSEQARKEEAGN